MANVKLIAIIATVVVVAAAVGTTVFVLSNKSNPMVVATSPDFAPYDWEYNGEYTGIDMDIVRAVFYNMGKEEGKDFKFEKVDFDGIILGVKEGKFKMGASGFTITEDRKANVLFSDFYATTQQVVLTKPGNPGGITESNLKDKNIAVQSGTTGENIARQYYANGTILSLKSYTDTVENVKIDKADCIIVDRETAKSMVVNNPGKLELRSEIVLKGEPEDYAFVFNLNDKELCDKFNDIMKKFMENTEGKNALMAITEYYIMAENPQEIPSFWKDHKLSDYKVI